MIKLITTGLSMLVLTGCFSQQPNLKPDPDYAPVQPRAAMPSDMAQTVSANGSLFNEATAVTLYQDNKARRVGDILTIVLQEATNASKSAATSTDKSDTTDISGMMVFGQAPRLSNVRIGAGNKVDLAASANSGTNTREFDGEGSSTQSNSLSGRISVTVTDVLPNGNMKVRGEKLMHLNQGDEYVRISGIVRQTDVQSDNTIPSTLVANAQISYGGNGAIAEANSQGWLSRFFRSVLWPF